MSGDAGSGGAASCSIARPSYIGDTMYLSKHHTAPSSFEGATRSCGTAASPAADIQGSPDTVPAMAARGIGLRASYGVEALALVIHRNIKNRGSDCIQHRIFLAMESPRSTQ